MSISDGMGEDYGSYLSNGLDFLWKIIKKIVEKITGYIPRIKRGVPFKIKFPYVGRGEKPFSESKEIRGRVSSPFTSIRKAIGETGLSFKHSIPVISKISYGFSSSIKYSGKVIQGLSQSIPVKGKKSFKLLDKLIDFLFEEELEDAESSST